MQPYVDNFSKAAVTVVSDGWDDRAKRSLLNVLTVTPMGAMFVKAIDTTGRMKTGQYIHDVLAEAIQELGPENVVQVVTDSAANCKAAGRLLEATFPRLTHTSCAAHCIDLFMEDVGKLEAVQGIVADGKAILKCITLHHATRDIFKTHSPNLTLLKPGDTR
jgi:hypothetical protein